MIKKSNFSLVELLVVISIIAVLMGILIPAVSSMKEKGRQTKARAEINAIVLAIKNYESTYGVLPCNLSTGADVTLSKAYGETESKSTAGGFTLTYDTLIQWLTQAPTDGSAPDTNGNVRKIKLLDPAAADGKSTYLDPWSNAGKPSTYVIVMDGNCDGKITINGKDYYTTVGIYSIGPNRINDYGKNKAQDGTNNTDDISSWHK